jgi:hypothetical protein
MNSATLAYKYVLRGTQLSRVPVRSYIMLLLWRYKLQSTGMLRGIRKENLHTGTLCVPPNRAYWYAEEVHIVITMMAYWYALSTY